ncbi:hypothetical protein E0485_01115 [Paenibacillus albiflavus]|uniref:Lipoprotein n=1 Tax=Paenibacillus albiflavus TaxID=2545760 RepID=A0A4R4EM81_9BACL|nr:hypothetical protein [Paenibacillus albiflavus]TCZ80917.1 hypothetical protein E0485_01115 [Paenibacillus albiflavus]
MKKIFIITLISFLLLTGCGKERTEELTGNQPPIAEIHIGDKVYETKLGTYCWSSENQGTCVDSIGPVELLKNEKPITVSPGAVIKFVINSDLMPNKFFVEQITGDHQITEVAVNDNAFQAPIQKGIYYYSYGVWWMDEKKPNVAHGDAFYNFVLEVM